MSESAVRAIAQRNLVFRLPLIGAFLRDAVFGHEDAKYYFIANVLITFAWAAYLYGYAFVIIAADIAAISAILTLVYLTSTDLIENRKRPPKPVVSALKYRPEKK